MPKTQDLDADVIVTDHNPYIGGDAHEDVDQAAIDRGDIVDPAEAEAAAKAAEEAEATAKAEEEAKATEEAEAKAAEEAAAAAATTTDDTDTSTDDPKPKMIPKKRFDEVNERMKRAEQAVQDGKAEADADAARADAPPVFDFDLKESEYMEAVLDGEKDKALALRREIRSEEKKLIEVDNLSNRDEAVAQSKAQREFDTVVAELEENVPAFAPKGEFFDIDVVNEVLDLQAGLVGRGYSPADALNKAARYVVGDAVDGTPAADADAGEDKPDTTAADKKKAADLKKKLDMAAGQPSNLDAGDSSSSAGDGVIDMENLSEKEFDSLPESKKRELRGDVI